MKTMLKPRDVIIIDDDESGRSQSHFLADRNYANDSDVISRFNKCFNRQQCCWKSADGFNLGHSEYSEKSYDDDCFVVEGDPIECGTSCLSWHLHKRASKGEKRPVIVRTDLNNSCSSLDSEIIEDVDGKIRQDWERAALKRRFGNSYMGSGFRAESEESTSAACSGRRLEFFGRGKGLFLQGDHKSPKLHIYDPEPSRNPSEKGKNPGPVTFLDQQDSNESIADTRSKDSVGSSEEEMSATDTFSLCSAGNLHLSEEGTSFSDYNTVLINSNPSEKVFSEDVMARQANFPAKHQVTVPAVAESLINKFSIVQKKVRKTEERDWVQCQEELQIQTKEAHCQQKKRRIDHEHHWEMESRQKQRLEDTISNQEEEERTHGDKGQVYGQRQSELDGVGASALDMITLLCNIGVEVDGGIDPIVNLTGDSGAL